MVATSESVLQVNGQVTETTRKELKKCAKDNGMRASEFIGEILTKYMEGELVEKSQAYDEGVNIEELVDKTVEVKLSQIKLKSLS